MANAVKKPDDIVIKISIDGIDEAIEQIARLEDALCDAYQLAGLTKGRRLTTDEFDEQYGGETQDRTINLRRLGIEDGNNEVEQVLINDVNIIIDLLRKTMDAVARR